MQFIGGFLFLFGFLIIAAPEIVAYLIGFFFIILGINILTAYFMLQRGKKETTGFRFGNYEIIRKK